GPHNKENCFSVWNKIIRLVHSICGPLLVIGDFNMIKDVSDKQGGSRNISHQIKEFQDFISASMLFDIPFKGFSYTWDNNRKDGASIHERIDRALGNVDLLKAFPHHMLTHHPLIGDNHAPLLYSTCETVKIHRRSFKFESIWALEESCKEAISNLWVNSSGTDMMFLLEKNLRNYANGLRSWSRDHFGNNKKIIDQLMRSS
ncbi:reverse transcriptase, partial [Tanacetum coccineum]